jgi:activator of Hsp90 ATPase-like protein
MIEPLHLAFEVDCPLEHAFDTWTQRTSSWWPPSHTVSGEPGLEVVFEGRAGGRIFERTPGGREVEWGEVTVWDRPRRLSYLWHIRTDRSDATEVEIRFSEQGASRTRVEIEHRGWERLGAKGAGWRTVNRSGWDGVLPHYVAACTRRATSDKSA